MEVLRFDDPQAFAREAGTVLSGDPDRNNMPLAILQTLLDHPEVFPERRLWLARSDDGPRGAALQTPPHNVIVAEPLEPGAVAALAEAVVVDGGTLPGVMANKPTAVLFSERVTALTGRAVEVYIEEGVWRLNEVADIPTPSGSARVATPADRELVLRLVHEFHAEALPSDHPVDEAAMERQLDLKLEGEGGGWWFWEDESHLSLSGFTVIPGIASRIGPVYTPPPDRRRGYAGKLVAELSAARLAVDGVCYLYTDLSNPTSNALYGRIGYEMICEAGQYAFRP
jgi:GNAT superfamily N-acetyltransferase